MMAMALHQRLARELRKPMVARPSVPEIHLGSNVCFFELLRLRVVGKETMKFVAKNGAAAWLQRDDRDSSKQWRPEGLMVRCK